MKIISIIVLMGLMSFNNFAWGYNTLYMDEISSVGVNSFDEGGWIHRFEIEGTTTTGQTIYESIGVRLSGDSKEGIEEAVLPLIRKCHMMALIAMNNPDKWTFSFLNIKSYGSKRCWLFRK